jgi:nitrate reductase assembly molybdenum cofactor insertion protein NarJ
MIIIRELTQTPKYERRTALLACHSHSNELDNGKQVLTAFTHAMQRSVQMAEREVSDFVAFA